MNKFTTVGDLVKALQAYDQGTPLIGFYCKDGLCMSNKVSVLGAYPDDDGKCDNVQVCFWDETEHGCGEVQATGEQWDRGDI